MMRSRFHRPWQPRMSDGQLFNPFAHSAEPESGLESHDDFEPRDADAEHEATALHAPPAEAAEEHPPSRGEPREG
jgi:hypothetical protein